MLINKRSDGWMDWIQVETISKLSSLGYAIRLHQLSSRVNAEHFAYLYVYL